MSEIIIGICVIAYIMIGIFLGELLFEVVIPCELASKLKEKM